MDNLNKYCEEDVIRGGKHFIFKWHPGSILDNVPLHQVYGFCVSKDGLVALVRDSGETRFTLPGGEINQGETAKDALDREFLEEAQFVPTNVRLLGSLEVFNDSTDDPIQKHHQEIRYACQIGDLRKFVPNGNGFETEERIFVKWEDVSNYVKWIASSATGKAQFAAFEEYLKEHDIK